jgi:hypothetical protein
MSCTNLSRDKLEADASVIAEVELIDTNAQAEGIDPNREGKEEENRYS